MPALVGGQSGTIQFQTDFASVGTKNLKAIVDPDNLINETDETNNEIATSAMVQAVSRPDLVITANDITFSNNNPLPGETVQITAKITNQGTEPSGTFKVLFTRGNPFISGAILIGEVDVASIPSSSNTNVNANIALPAGTHEIYVVADFQKIITELSETNNQAHKNVITKSLPDLTSSSELITLSHEDLSLGVTVGVSAVISNLGQSPAGEFTVILLDKELPSGNTVVISKSTISELQAGKSTEVNGVWNPNPGNHKIHLLLDSESVITEKDETNNDISKEFFIDGPQEAAIKIFNITDENNPIETNIFNAYEKMEINVSHFWGENTVIHIYIEDRNGGIYTATDEDDKFIWNTSNAASGLYDVKINILSEDPEIVVENGIVLLKGNILETQIKTVEIKPTYSVNNVELKNNPKFTLVGETVTLSLKADVRNKSNDSADFDIVYRVKSPSLTLLTEKTKTVNFTTSDRQKQITLDPFAHTFDIAGDYIIELEVFYNGNSLAQHSIKFPVLKNVHIKITRDLTPPEISSSGDGKVHVSIKVEGVE